MLRSFLSPTKRLSHYCSQEGCSQYDWTATTGAPLHGIIVPACLLNIHTHTLTNSRYIIMLADFMILLPVFHTLPGHSFPVPSLSDGYITIQSVSSYVTGMKKGDETDSARDWPESSCTFIYRPFFFALCGACMCVCVVDCVYRFPQTENSETMISDDLNAPRTSFTRFCFIFRKRRD